MIQWGLKKTVQDVCCASGLMPLSEPEYFYSQDAGNCSFVDVQVKDLATPYFLIKIVTKF